MLLPFARQLNGTFYTITGISVHRSHMSAKLDRNVISVIDIPEKVLIFINGPLECVNHFFLEELASQAARREVGIVTGLSLDYRARILHSGLMSKADGTPVDPFAGQLLPDVSDWFHLQAVREVEAISSHFFAIKRELLTDSGALSAVNADRTERFLAEISRHAAAAQLKILVTPFAIASFAYFDTAYTFAAAHASRRPIPANANLVSFLQAAHPTHCSG
jgi:hypothetical protein